MSSNGDHHMGGGARAEASTEPVLCSNGCGFYGCARRPRPPFPALARARARPATSIDLNHARRAARGLGGALPRRNPLTSNMCSKCFKDVHSNKSLSAAPPASASRHARAACVT